LFIDDGRVTSIVDWQDVWVGPPLPQAQHPRLVDYDGKMLLRLPDNYEDMADSDEKAGITDRVERSILL
jgi:hypothetical protein